MVSYGFNSISESQFKEMQNNLREIGGYNPIFPPFECHPQGKKMIAFIFSRPHDDRTIELSFWYDNEREKSLSGIIGSEYAKNSEDKFDELLKVIESKAGINFSPLEAIAH